MPFLLIFVFRDEKPSDDSLFVFFSLFGVLTVIDRSLERIPCYYVFKLALFFFLYAPPFVLHKALKDAIQEMVNGKVRGIQKRKHIGKVRKGGSRAVL